MESGLSPPPKNVASDRGQTSSISSKGEGPQGLHPSDGTVPVLLRVYSTILMLMAGTSMAYCIGANSDGEYPLSRAILFLIALIHVVVWNKLREGQRWAVQVITVFAILLLVATIYSGILALVAYDLLGPGILQQFGLGLFFLLVVYLPPLISVRRHSDAFPRRRAPQGTGPILVRAYDALLGNDMVPVVVRVYAILLMIGGAVTMAVWVRNLGELCIEALRPEWAGSGYVEARSPLGCALGFTLALVHVLVWDKLRRTRNEGSIAALVRTVKEVGEYIRDPHPAGKSVPAVLRVYGIIFLILSAAGMVACLADARYEDNRPLALAGLALWGAHAWVSIELRRGMRWAVRVMQFLAVVLAGFPVLICIVMLAASDVMPARELVHIFEVLGTLGIILAIYLPLLISAHRHWKDLAPSVASEGRPEEAEISPFRV
jgi:hypothetical protein